MQTRLLLLLGLLLSAAVFCIYAPASAHLFLDYDDRAYVTGNPMVQQGLSHAGWRWAWTTFHASNWHPLTWLSHMLDCQLFGPRPFGPHLVNVGLHAVNTLLVFLVLHGMTRAIWRPALVAALFALHPLHVESVAWVAERKDLLSTCFGLLALEAYRRYVRRPSFLRYTLLLGVFALSLLAKPMLVTLPFLLLLLDYWPLRRFPTHAATLGQRAGPGSETTEEGTPAVPLSRLLLEKVPLLAIAAGSCMVTLYAQLNGAVVSLDKVPLAVRVANAVLAYTGYLRKMVWPTDLAILYPHPGSQISVTAVLGSAFVLTALTVLAVWQRRRRPALLVGWSWYLGTLVPVIGLVQVGEQSMADRYTYFPLLGIFLALAWSIPTTLADRAGGRIALASGSAIVLLFCALLTRSQLSFWQDEETVWRHALQVTDNNAVAHQSLGTYLFNQGRTAEGTRHLERATRIAPDNALALHNLGLIRLMQGQDEEAVDLFRRAVANAPWIGHYHDSLGLALVLTDRREEARGCFQEAIRLGVENAEPYYNLAATLDEENEHAAAAAVYAEGLRRDPEWPAKALHLAHTVLSGDPPWSPCPRLALWRARQADAAGDRRPEVKATLALAYAANDRMPEAAAATRQALALVRDGDPLLVRRLQAAIRYYEAAPSRGNKSH